MLQMYQLSSWIALTMTLLGATSGYAQGCLFDPIEAAKQPLYHKPTLGFAKNTLSFRDSCPPIGNQKNCKSCVAWACSYYGLSLSKKQGANPFSPHFICAKTQHCEKGMTVPEAVNIIQNQWVPAHTTYAEVPCDWQEKKLKETHVEKFYQRDTNPNAPISRLNADVKDFMERLKYQFSNYAIIAVLRFDESQKELKGANTFLTPTPPVQKSTQYHAVCVTGFDSDEDNGFLEIVNSWGSDWGDKGFAKIKREHIPSVVVAVYAFKK
jgi:C1A family cysteine protease